MKLYHQDEKEGGLFQMSDFTCPTENIRMNTERLYRIIWVLEDGCEFLVDTLPVKVNKNQLIFFTPHNQVEFLSDEHKVISLSFNREFYCINDHDHEVSCYGFLFYGSTSAPVVTLDEEQAESLHNLIQVFREEFHFTDHIQGEMLRVLLKRLLIKSSRLTKQLLINPEIKDSQLDIVRRFNVLVEMHFRQKHQVKDYADLLFKSPKTLSNLFAQYNSQSPLQVINQRLVLEAKRLLAHSDKTVEELAFELGYSDAANFSRFFKKHVGESPISFRKRQLVA
ncbi:helix-turn-helix transcriptional regulator [bacterium SCSIO 12741]|nr:helix-turn-helix transcriptional regulator [bacterium SCSIO 12741]